MEHLYERLKQYAASDYYPYHMPGHKRTLYGDLPVQMLQMDLTEIDGFDNLHQPEEILKELQQKAAELYGAEESFYLVNGSTGGILSAVSAAVQVGGRLLMARNCHKSAYHAAYLRNLTISYLYPDLLEEYDICDVISPGQVQAALEEQPNIDAVLLVSPTYEGRIAEIERIAQIVHERGIPLIVDEAHGAHLGWKGGGGVNSCQAGADLVIHSVHKTLPSMTQTALLHVNGSLIDRDRLRRFLRIYQSSSPSYVLMASIDNALNLMEKRGPQLFSDFFRQYDEMAEMLSACRHLEFPALRDEKQDVGKLIISTKRFGLSGQRLYDILLKDYRLQLEMAAETFCLAMFTVGDGPEAYARMTEALLSIENRMEQGSLKPDQTLDTAVPGKEIFFEDFCGRLRLCEAWDLPWEWILLQQAVGRYVGEFVNLYPPGVPLLVPGEIMTSRHYARIVSYLEQGLKVQGIEQSEGNYKIKVLRKRSI